MGSVSQVFYHVYGAPTLNTLVRSPALMAITSLFLVTLGAIHLYDRYYQGVQNLQRAYLYTHLYPCRYTPFAQTALAQRLDPNWDGSCHFLSYSWMYRKTRSAHFQEPSSYTMTDLSVPYPIILGQNQESGEDIQTIQKSFAQFDYASEVLGQEEIDETTQREGIDSLITYLKSRDQQSVLVMAGWRYENDRISGHACGFVKRGDECSWFDPNYGEVTFETFEDFSLWFYQEVMYGQLVFLFQEAFLLLKKKKNEPIRVSDSIAPLHFSKEEQNASAMSQKITSAILNKQSKSSCAIRGVFAYGLQVHFPEKEGALLQEVPDIAFM